MSQHPTPDLRDLRPKGRPGDHSSAAKHYSALAAEARRTQSTADYYVGLLAELRAELDAALPITEADFFPAGYDHADEAPVF